MAVVFNVNVGMAAFTGALLLTLVRAADERAAFKAIPWSVIIPEAAASRSSSSARRVLPIPLSPARKSTCPCLCWARSRSSHA